jgi:hypothetical protein
MARPSTGAVKPAQGRPGGGQVAQTRPVAGGQPGAGRPGSDVRPGQERPGTGTRPEQRPGEGQNANREDWQQWGDDRQDSRQDFLGDQQEDRQKFMDNQFEEVDWDEVDWDEADVWEDDEFEWNSGFWLTMTVGTALTVAAWDSMRAQPTCNFMQVVVDGQEYYKCGSTWYIQAMSAGSMHYVAVNSPAGY